MGIGRLATVKLYVRPPTVGYPPRPRPRGHNFQRFTHRPQSRHQNVIAYRKVR